jgi:hypothetical protein
MIGVAWIQKQVRHLGLIVQINLSINPYSRPLNSTAISTCLQHLNRTFINNDDIFSFHPPRAQGSDRSLLNLVNLPVSLHQLKYHDSLHLITVQSGDINYSPVFLFTGIACTLTVQHLNIPEQPEGCDPGWRGDLKWTLKKTWTM